MTEDPIKATTIAKRDAAHSYGHGSMICAVMVAIMVFYWFTRRLLGNWNAEQELGVPTVLGTIAFFIGHILAITALFSRKTVTWKWGRAALVTMWVSVVLLILASFVFLTVA